MRDDLLVWQQVRARIDWPDAAAPIDGPVRGSRDGIAHLAATREAARGQARADRLLTAWHLAQADARHRRPLTFTRLARWQQSVLGRPGTVGFRSGPAFAKGGRERYGLRADTRERFAHCLAQSAEPAPTLPARAARAYLDVCFFHPFPDGNGRSALLALGFVLAREGVLLDEVGPLRVPRFADDPAGAEALARLVSVLISAAHRRHETAGS